MATLYILHAHQDKTYVEEILQALSQAGHDLVVETGRPAEAGAKRRSIQENIRAADFVVPFLSTTSIKDPWIGRAVYESLLDELTRHRQKLQPCLIQLCGLPPAFNKLTALSRLRGDFILDKKRGVEQLLACLAAAPPPVFEAENHLTLNIGQPDLEIYMTGDFYNFEKKAQLRYFETMDQYLLFGFLRRPKTLFKHFVVCPDQEIRRVRALLQGTGYVVTGTDLDLETSRRRVWFLVKDFPIVFNRAFFDNMWP